MIKRATQLIFAIALIVADGTFATSELLMP
jgi:hypothetical protein